MKKGKKFFLTGGIAALTAGTVCALTRCRKQSREESVVDTEKYRRLNCYYDIMIKWMYLRQENESPGKYLKSKGIQKVGIYGHGKIGVLLCRELLEDGIEVAYFLDMEAEEDYHSIGDVLVTSPEKVLKQADTDAILVTPAFAFDEIKTRLEKYGYRQEMISLSELLYSI